MTVPKPTEHVVMFSIDAWGHVRPLCSLATKIIQMQRVHITFLTTPGFADRVKTEVSRHLIGVNEKTRSLNGTIISLRTSDIPDLFSPEEIFQAFANTFDRLLNEEPLTCARTGQQYDALPAPKSVILDMFCSVAMQSVRDKSGKSVKIYLWYPGAASFLIPVCAPPSKGGRGDFRAQIYEEVSKNERDIKEVAEEILLGNSGHVFRVPGLPPFYDYELLPQENLPMFEGLDKCDSMILSSSEALEPGAVSVIREWFQETSRSLLTVGPTQPLLQNMDFRSEDSLSQDPDQIAQFMTSILTSHGPESLLYISFGSVFWPIQPEKMWAVLDVIMEKQIPFILSHGSPVAMIPDEVKVKVDEYALGKLTSWSPQQAILAHPVTGWFMTHGGQNSTMEAVTAGVPMIFWPYHGDQPVNALHLSDGHDAAYELFEIRSGEGLRPICRTGKTPSGTIESVRIETAQVLDDAFGAGGEKKRENVKRLQEKVLAGLKDGGSSKADLETLAQQLVSGSV
ncbi:UDP-Glycosyltransferase/glycogen phosphorylase [Abortiporus biennis]|nr:UDP-Glycosyltransferase/glycogen phosphorylase [Abortiporus biennis]